MSSSNQGSVRDGGRAVSIVQRGALGLGVMLAFGAIALLYLAAEDPALATVKLAGAPLHPQRIALGMAALAAVIVALNIASAVRALRPNPVLEPGAFPAGSGLVSVVGEPAPYRGDVLLELSEPKPSGAQTEIMLLDAVRLAFSESQGSAAGAFATAFADDPDDVVTMYATFFAEHVPIYGCKRPSSALEQVFLMAPLKEFAVEEGALVLKERTGDAVYDGISIKATDCALVLERLRSGA